MAAEYLHFRVEKLLAFHGVPAIYSLLGRGYVSARLRLTMNLPVNIRNHPMIHGILGAPSTCTSIRIPAN
jgi:hypothetical protein